MKNLKRAAAILGVVVLMAVCCLPMIFAFGSGDNAQGNFKAAVGSVILVPVLAYVFLMVQYLKQFIAGVPVEYEEDVKRVIDESEKTVGIKDYAETWTSYLKSQGYHLYVLSNYSQLMLDRTRPNKMPFLKNMDGVIFSCEVGQIKPEADIYKTLLSRYGLKPEESVFLDDRPENCEAARKLGIHAIEFHDLKQAAKELEKLGVKQNRYISAKDVSTMNYFDCHADTLTEIPTGETLNQNSGDLDLNRLGDFVEKYTQIFAVWKDSQKMDKEDPEKEFLWLYHRAMAYLEEENRKILMCKSGEEMK